MSDKAHPNDPDGVLLDMIQFSAWSSLMNWLLSKPEVMAEFEAHTGVTVPKPRAGIEAMIDKACGHDPSRDFLRAFLPWATTHHWGDGEATPSIRAVLERVAAA